MSNHLTQPRIAAVLAVTTQPEGETPWRLLLTKPPMTHPEVRAAIYRAEHPEDSPFSDVSRPTLQAEASRARIVQDLARRDGYLTALSVSEHMLSASPVLPTRVSIELAPWAEGGPLVEFSFHDSAAEVHAFATHFGTEVTELPHLGTDLRIETVGANDGVRFVAFTLVDGPAVAE
ncbi:hypothetical protein JHN55_31665 [Streptomyces sp. MBT56]|uniref:hypothetical protein n=1 Tax=unclassified Streptomyces TaxID=2593676 RepID=UPI00190911E9|nr:MULTISPECIES: hypothetical protein [unclassified Streptomyces]MBK3561011.1 hypothetical protein [Streptomyces sp. MBT56]MBK3605615.1 hypothetical protein [Streptomyces sp. MBT54]MBK3619922.1 hypothetical protein [Streptomyces sp. MBT98]MBK6045736.1 hypothetical protein [Streptomyces sp. MBT55]